MFLLQNPGPIIPNVLRTHFITNKFWVRGSRQTSVQHLQGYARDTWLGHGGNIAHLAGSGRGELFFKYPLKGDFEFTFETQAGGRPGTDGGVGFGGIDYEVNVTDELFFARGREAWIHRPYSNLTDWATRIHEKYVWQPQFHRFTLSANSGRVAFLASWVVRELHSWRVGFGEMYVGEL